MSGPPATGRFVVYLLDPGPHSGGARQLVEQAAGVDARRAAEMLDELPCAVASFDRAGAARDLALRFREFDAVAVVRRAGERPSAPPVARPESGVALPWVRRALLGLSILQLGVSAWWLREGRLAAAFFGALLALCAALYCRRRD